MLNSSFNRAKKIKTSAFPGSLTYALVREVCRSQYFSISDWYVVSRAHKLPCFAQTNKHPTDRPITLPLVRASRARGNEDIESQTDVC